MQKIGMKFRQVGTISTKTDPDKQEDFKNVLNPEITEAKAGESALLFTDGAPFVQSEFLGCLWCFERIFVRDPSGRKRWNVLGAFNAVTGQLTSVTNDGYVTAAIVDITDLSREEIEQLRTAVKNFLG